ncbi:nucleotidyltransferase family protein [Brachybacterium huguangmaarense]
MPTHLETPRDTLLRLAHGCLESLADDAGARVLHVKGVALAPELTEGRPGSSDCDVLVHPDDVTAYVEALASHGWEQRTHFAQGSVFGHAATLYSPVWGTVDVHRTFPGLDADPTRTFETLWRDARRVELGSVACAVPSLTHQRVIMLVHAARDHMGRRAGDVTRAWTSATDAERDAVDAVARDLGAVVPLALVTGRPELARGGRDEHLWRAMLSDADPTVIWWARLRDARTPVAAARVIAAGLHVNQDHLQIRLGRPPTAQEVRQDWWRRWGRGLGRTWRLVRRR